MFDFLVTIMAFIIGLGVLITFHELGHFLVARACGVKVLCFSIGFGKTLFSRTTQDGTEYRIALLPLGGYVKMLGERDDVVNLANRSSAFNQKSVWARIAIVLAGPLFNFIFAFFAYVWMLMIGVQGITPFIGSITPHSIAAKVGMAFPVEIVAIDNKPTPTWQEVVNQIVPRIGDKETTLAVRTKSIGLPSFHTYTLPLNNWNLDSKNPDLIKSLGWEPLRLASPAIVATLTPGGAAEKSGLQPNDQITYVSGQSIVDATSLVSALSKRPNMNTILTVIRDNHTMDIALTPGSKVLKNGQLSGHIGVTLQAVKLPKEWIRTQQYSFINSFKPAYKQTIYYTEVSFKLMAKMIMGKLSPSTLSGPIGIAQGAGATFKNGFQYYLGFLALISISLGVVNLLPIPILDGGHLFYYIIEVITRRPVSQKIQDKASVIGLVFILSLMSVSFYNDIARLF